MSDAPRYTPETLKARRAGLPPYPGMTPEDSERIRVRIDQAGLALQDLADELAVEMEAKMRMGALDGWIPELYEAVIARTNLRHAERVGDVMDRMWDDVERLRQAGMSRAQRMGWNDERLSEVLEHVVRTVYP